MARVYATASDLEDYLRSSPPDDADRLLERASELLDSEVLRGAWYDIDATTLMPTNAQVIAAFRQAVCAQVEFWEEVGEQNDTSGLVEDVSIGSARIRYGIGADRVGPKFVAPRVIRALTVLPSSVFRGGVAGPGWAVW